MTSPSIVPPQPLSRNCAFSNLKGRVTNSYGRFDLRSGKIEAYFAGDSHSLQEPYFLPRTRQGLEGAGYLIGMASTKMSCPLHNRTSQQLTRRMFVARCAATAASGAALCTAPGLVGAVKAVPSTTAATAAYRTPVVSFHIDRPYIDTTGTAIPYLPPAGIRSGQPIADLSVEEYLRHHPYS